MVSWYEDYPVGSSRTLRPITVTLEEIRDFAAKFDPQPIHVDPDAAAGGPYGGIIASGWHTCALVMRSLVDGYISVPSALGSPGIDELRWRNPVRPGDVLTIDITVAEARTSTSKPDRGIVRTAIEVKNQTGQTVLSMVANNLVLRRPATELR